MGEILPVSQGAEQETSSVQEIAIDAPAGIIEGNLMRCLITSTASGVPPNITMDDGLWQQVIQIEMDVALAGTMAGYYKIATASEPATYTARISGGANLNMTGQISQYSGVNTDTPQDATRTLLLNQETATYDPPSIDAATPKAMVETCVFARQSGILTPAAPSGYTEYGDAKGSTYYAACAYKEVSGAGTEDPAAWGTFGVTASCMGFTWIMRPVGAGGDSAIGAGIGSGIGTGIG